MTSQVLGLGLGLGVVGHVLDSITDYSSSDINKRINEYLPTHYRSANTHFSTVDF